jgi:hypothetical protein
MADITTFHQDAARTGAERGASRFGSWAKRYEVRIPGHPPIAPADSDPELGGGTPLWFPSSVRGAPLYLGRWTIEEGARHGQVVDMVIVATSDGYLHAYDHSTSRTGSSPVQLWEQSLGPARYHISVPAFPRPDDGRGPLSNIPRPIGITSTPVIDSAARRLFAGLVGGTCG